MPKKIHFTNEQVDEVWKIYVNERMPILFDLSNYNLQENEALCPACQEVLYREQYHVYASEPEHSWHLHHYDLDQKNDDVSNLDPMHLACSPTGISCPVYLSKM